MRCKEVFKYNRTIYFLFLLKEVIRNLDMYTLRKKTKP